MNALIRRLPVQHRGPAWMVLASAAFAAMWGLIRLASDDLSPFVIVFWRNAFGLLVLAPIWLRRPRLLSTMRLQVHVRRAASGIVATFATFYAIANSPLSEVLAITYSAPLFATIGAALFLHERIRVRRIAALLVGFAGVLLVLRPGSAPLTPGLAAAILAAVSTAFSLVAIKQLVGTDEPLAVTIWSFVLMLGPAALVAIWFWSWPQPLTWVALAGIGGLAVVGQIGMTRAFQLAEASALMPFDFVRFALVTAIGVGLFGQRFDLPTLAGGTLALGATIYLAYREAVAARGTKPASQPPLA